MNVLLPFASYTSESGMQQCLRNGRNDKIVESSSNHQFTLRIRMAGITSWLSGEQATVSEIYWHFEEGRLSYQVKLEKRMDGKDEYDTVVWDYGSDIGIDPNINPQDKVIFFELDQYSGIWICDAGELHFSQIQAAHDRVVRNRRFLTHCKSGNSGHDEIEQWLQELATQTQKNVFHDSGSIFPGSVAELDSFSLEIREWLGQDEGRLKQLSAESFERLLMSLFQSMSYFVRPVSETLSKDGGVDLIAWPESSIPHVIAVQAKHHTTDNKTGSSDARDFFGVLQGHGVFSFGMLVTNTRFTTDAKHFADKAGTSLRLRDGNDISRWLIGDFSSELEWKEIPSEINLAPGVSVGFSPSQKASDLQTEMNQVRSVLDLYLPRSTVSATPFGR